MTFPHAHAVPSGIFSGILSGILSRLPSAFLLLGVTVCSAAAKAPPNDLLIVWPLDTNVVSVDSSVSTAALAGEKSARRPPSPAFLVVRNFHPVFGEAIARAARRIGVVDSSGAATDLLALSETVRFPDRGDGDSVSFRLPVAADADSARYALVLGSLSFASETKTVARRFVPPSPPGFDPATGEMTPGDRRGHSEGPGRMTTLTASAAWVIWDREAGVAAARGTAAGNASFRGEARKADWDAAARELAKTILYQTSFAPPR